MISDRISIIQTNSINILNDINELFNKLINTSQIQINISFVLETSDLIKMHLGRLGKDIKISY